MITVEIANRSARGVDAAAVEALARHVLSGERVAEGELGIAFVEPEEMRRLKLEHLGLDEVTDVLSFPIDVLDELPKGVPRALGDVVLCPELTGDDWRRPLVHGLLHLLGYDHGEEMDAREREHAS